MKNGFLTLVTIACAFGIGLLYKSTYAFVLSYGDGFTIGFSVGLISGLLIVNCYVKMAHGHWP